ncbi:unnamed protein product [Symbiodinium sp. KB8]|nr:unnamed protein product [Symbiodinium sp. KB8]
MLFSTHKELWSDFGIYEPISKNQGADAEGLAANRVFLKKLLHLQPSAVLLLTQVRQSVLRVLAAEPTLNKTNNLKPREKASEKLKHGKPKPATVVAKPAFKYLKEYYKANGTFGVKTFSGSGAERQCHGQIFSFGHRYLKRSQIEPLAVKVLLDLHRYAGQSTKEEEIKVIAQHKISKMLIRE